MKTFGLLAPAGKGSTFEKNGPNLLVDQDGLAPIVLPMLEPWRSMRVRAAELGRQLVAGARQRRSCQILMSIPGVGAITATSFVTAIEEPDNFKNGDQCRQLHHAAWFYRNLRHASGLLIETRPVQRTSTPADDISNDPTKCGRRFKRRCILAHTCLPYASYFLKATISSRPIWMAYGCDVFTDSCRLAPLSRDPSTSGAAEGACRSRCNVGHRPLHLRYLAGTPWV